MTDTKIHSFGDGTTGWGLLRLARTPSGSVRRLRRRWQGWRPRSRPASAPYTYGFYVNQLLGRPQGRIKGFRPEILARLVQVVRSILHRYDFATRTGKLPVPNGGKLRDVGYPKLCSCGVRGGLVVCP